MNWKLVARLSLLGPVMGALTVAGAFPRGVDRVVWFLVVAVCALVVARTEHARAFAHGALVGFANGAASTLVQGLLSDTLVANNPWIAEAFSRMPDGFDAQFFIMMLVPFIGIASGTMTGLIAHLAARAIGPRARGDGETAP